MSLEHSPARYSDRAAFTIAEFCHAHRISRSTYYNLKKVGKGPREKEVFGRIIITNEAAAEWRAGTDTST
jgi:hypothetical protein